MDEIMSQSGTYFEHNGKRKNLADWGRSLGISRERMRQRVEKCLARGVDLSEAFDTPAGECIPSFQNFQKRGIERRVKSRLETESKRRSKVIKDKWFDGSVHFLQRGKDWPAHICCESLRNIINTESRYRGGKCRFRILNDHLMFVFESKNSAK